MWKRILGQRLFSKNVKQIEKEFYENPLFHRAFPDIYNKLELTEQEQQVFQDPKIAKKKAPWFSSLLYKHRNPQEKTAEWDLEQQISKEYVEGFRHPKGAFKYMPQDQKDKIHSEAEKVMEELEKTGLSRQEILWNKVGGIPLAQDPFFQFIKTNRKAREIMFRGAEIFSVEKIIDKSLTQNIGPDMSVAQDKAYHTFKHKLSDEFYLNSSYGTQNFKQRELKPSDYYFSADPKDKQKQRDLEDDLIGIEFKTQPLHRDKHLEKYQRKVDSKQFSWKNTEFLSKFLTDTAKIKNRWETRLSQKLQIKLQKAVKRARHMVLLPAEGMLKESDKISLKPLWQSVEDQNKLIIDANTGMIYPKFYENEYIQNLTKQELENLKKTQPQTEEDQSANISKFHEIKQLEINNAPVLPTNDQLQLLDAIAYLRYKKSQQQKIVGYQDKNQYFGSKENLDKIQERISENFSLNFSSIENIAEAFLAEKNFSPEILNKINKKLKAEKDQAEKENRNSAEILSEILEKKKNMNIPLTEEEINIVQNFEKEQPLIN